MDIAARGIDIRELEIVITMIRWTCRKRTYTVSAAPVAGHSETGLLTFLH